MSEPGILEGVACYACGGPLRAETADQGGGLALWRRTCLGPCGRAHALLVRPTGRGTYLPVPPGLADRAPEALRAALAGDEGRG